MVYTKLQAAINQLQVSLYLFASYRDPASVHALASNAESIFRDLCKNTNNTVQRMDDYIDHEHLDTMHTKKNAFYSHYLHRWWNFLKHSGKETIDSTEEFNDELNALMLFRACCYLNHISKEQKEINHLDFTTRFFDWMRLQKPSFFKVDVSSEKIDMPKIYSENRRLFFNKFITEFESSAIYPSN